MKPIDPRGMKIGPIWMTPEVSRLHVATFMYASLVTIGMLTFVNIATSYVLRENLGVDREEFGSITGNLQATSEITIMLTVGLFGVLCDRIGRRFVYALGMLLMGVSYILTPLATTVLALVIFRVVYAAGTSAATGMLGTVTNDYPQEISRGKLIALSGVLLGIGAIFANIVFGGLPTRLMEQGYDSIAAGQITHWIVAAICIVSALIIGLGLKPGTMTSRDERLSFGELVRTGFTAAKQPRIALCYATAFVARSDMVIIGAFTIAWGTVAGQELGLDTATSVQRGTIMFVTAQSAGLLWTPVMGYLMDRFNRITITALGAGISFIAFSSTIFIADPFDNAYLPLFALLGIGQISFFFSSQALIGQEAPVKARGAVIGAFGTCGAIGILFFSIVGGRLFDSWQPAGPFVLVGCAALIILVASIFVRLKWPGYTPSDPIKNANVVITGSTRGIGYGMAREFLKRGNSVVVTGRTQEAVDQAVSRLTVDAIGSAKVAGIACDVGDVRQVQNLFDKARESVGDIDIWINNAGINNSRMPIAKLPFWEMENVAHTNLLGMFNGCKVALEGMRAQGKGAIYNFEGFGSNGKHTPGSSIYGSTKFAVRYFTKALVKETKKEAVLVGTISPGIVLTDMITRDKDVLPPPAWKAVKRVYNILADRVETVTPYLVDGVLHNKKHGGKVHWLTRGKSGWRFFKARFGIGDKRDFFAELEPQAAAE